MQYYADYAPDNSFFLFLLDVDFKVQEERKKLFIPIPFNILNEGLFFATLIIIAELSTIFVFHISV